MVAPAGPMYQAGTLSGNPLAMTAGIETLKRLKERPHFEVDIHPEAAVRHDSLGTCTC